MALIPVPLIGQTLNASRAPINSNFATINTAFLVDHVGYNDPGQGQHNKISFPIQNPVPAPQAGIVQLYSQLSTLTTQPELVYTRQSGSTAPTAVQITEFTSAGWANPGWTKLPSGILLKWISALSFAGNSFINLNINAGFPGSPPYDTFLSSMLTTNDPTASYNNVIGNQGFDIPTKVLTIATMNGNAPPLSVTVNILIIGY